MEREVLPLCRGESQYILSRTDGEVWTKLGCQYWNPQSTPFLDGKKKKMNFKIKLVYLVNELFTIVDRLDKFQIIHKEVKFEQESPEGIG